MTLWGQFPEYLYLLHRTGNETTLLESICFPHGAGYSFKDTAQMQRDAGNQAARSCWPCTRMNCKTPWLSPRRYQELTDHSSWQSVGYEGNDITTMKTKQSRTGTKNFTSSKKASAPLLFSQPNDSKRANSHYQLNLTKAELQRKKGQGHLPERSFKPTQGQG